MLIAVYHLGLVITYQCKFKKSLERGIYVTYVFWANIGIHMNSHKFLVITEQALYWVEIVYQ
jgi:hypothetical protein